MCSINKFESNISSFAVLSLTLNLPSVIQSLFFSAAELHRSIRLSNVDLSAIPSSHFLLADERCKVWSVIQDSCWCEPRSSLCQQTWTALWLHKQAEKQQERSNQYFCTLEENKRKQWSAWHHDELRLDIHT